MKIFSADQIRKWDEYTIKHEPISSLNLMERAAGACVTWLEEQMNVSQYHLHVFCGKGNNGGDGLAMARMMIEKHYRVTVYILEFGNKGTSDFQSNLERLHPICQDYHFIQSTENFPVIDPNDIIIDALFGSGLNKAPAGISAALIDHINQSKAAVVAIDIPSGLFADTHSTGNNIIKANYTLCFQQYKPACFFAENEDHLGGVQIIPIGLHPAFEQTETALLVMTDEALIRSIYQPRKNFVHKGSYGHAALVTGSYGMMGAAVLSAQSCLRSGVGKLTCFIPRCGYEIVQTAVPEAMCTVSGDQHIFTVSEPERFSAIGMGPGMGIYPEHKPLLAQLLDQRTTPLILDADALNTLSLHRELMALLPPGTIITPHPGEFERLFGKVSHEMEQWQLAKEQAQALQIYIVLKGHYTNIFTPEGNRFVNSTGNPGMATAGSGDVLSGIITGLRAQGYSALEACLMGTYLHGMAGDLAAADNSMESLIAGDITAYLGAAFSRIADNY